MTTISLPNIVQQKLAAFDRLETEFVHCFRFLEEVHGRKRFPAFPISYTVRYLHALWIAECKTGLLSVSKTVKMYEGRPCLELLLHWQQECDTASVVGFLSHKLDTLPLEIISRQVQEARRSPTNDKLAKRLEHGRVVMLNRGMNLLHALDAIFALPEDELQCVVSMVCERYGHHPEQIAQQLEEIESPLFAFVPHQVLAQRNMLIMNKLGEGILSETTDQRVWRVHDSTAPLPPFAEQIIQPYLDMTAANHNNMNRGAFPVIEKA